MKQLVLLLLFLVIPVSVQAYTLEAGVSIEDVPKEIYGQWQIRGKLDSTSSAKIFKAQSVDFWDMSRKDGVITLENPLNGAKAEVLVNTVEGNLIVFTKKIHYDNKVLTDKVTIRLNKNDFTGYNDLKLETFSLIDNHLLKTETAKYSIKGEKIAGENVLGE